MRVQAIHFHWCSEGLGHDLGNYGSRRWEESHIKGLRRRVAQDSFETKYLHPRDIYERAHRRSNQVGIQLRSATYSGYRAFLQLHTIPDHAGCAILRHFCVMC